MLRSMYSGVSGLKTQQVRLDVIGNNIANSNTVGFKQGDVYFKDMINQNLGNTSNSPFNKQVGLGVTIGAVDTKFTQGTLSSTGSVTDFAIEGDGLFIIATPNQFPNGLAGATVDFTDPAQTGTLQYTRDGIFSWDSEGYLVTVDGNYVLNENGGLIRLEETTNAVPTVPVESVLGIATFTNYAGLTKNGNNSYSQTEISGTPLFGGASDVMTDPVTGVVLEAGKITSGVVELSNVDLSVEFTNMIIASRSFQANSRIITTSDEMLQELVNLKR